MSFSNGGVSFCYNLKMEQYNNGTINGTIYNIQTAMYVIKHEIALAMIEVIWNDFIAHLQSATFTS